MSGDKDFIFLNINEEGEIYRRGNSIATALEVLREFPNDSVEIRIVGEWNLWILTYNEKPEWWDDPFEPRCDHCGVHTEDGPWCGECGNCKTHCECA